MKHLYYLLFTFSLGFAQVPTVFWVDGANGNDSNNGTLPVLITSHSIHP